MDETPGQDVIDFILAQASTNGMNSEKDDESEIDDDSIRSYLNFVSDIPADFEPEALALLKYYFVVTRAIRPSKAFYYPFNHLFNPILFINSLEISCVW